MIDEVTPLWPYDVDHFKSNFGTGACCSEIVDFYLLQLSLTIVDCYWLNNFHKPQQAILKLPVFPLKMVTLQPLCI